MTKTDISLEDKKLIIIDFLEKCNGYSDQMLVKYQQEILEAMESDKQAIEQKINQWKSYREFNAFAIGELGTTQLDDWF
jgi:hypothetical protein